MRHFDLAAILVGRRNCAALPPGPRPDPDRPLRRSPIDRHRSLGRRFPARPPGRRPRSLPPRHMVLPRPGLQTPLRHRK